MELDFVKAFNSVLGILKLKTKKKIIIIIKCNFRYGKMSKFMMQIITVVNSF